MKRRRFLPVGMLSLLLVMALASIGVAYTMWSEELWIYGTVETGGVDVEFSGPHVWENDHGKDVAECGAEIWDNQLNIWVWNGYPSYECWVDYDIHNIGSIPVHVYGPEWWWFPPANEVTVETWCDCPCGEGVENCTGCDVIQLHHSETVWCHVYIHVEQEAVQWGWYDFQGYIVAHQFNEPW